MRKIAIVTFDPFNELDSLIALHMFGRVREHGLHADLVAATDNVTSMNGVRVVGVRPLAWAQDADVVLFGSGPGTRTAIQDAELMERVRPDLSQQLVGSQCSGALVLQRLGFIGTGPACTDDVTRPTLVALGVRVLDRPFYTSGNLAMAGGCFAAQYLASWAISRTLGWERARDAIAYVAPVGEVHAWTARVEATLAAAPTE